MSLDLFVFTPPSLDDLTLAVERAQKAASTQAFRFVRRTEVPSASEFAAAVRNARHLTAIQRTLRKMGGPLFDPASPLPPGRRYELLMRRIEQVEASMADDPDGDDGFSGESAPDADISDASFSRDSQSGQSVAASSPLDFAWCPPDIEDLVSAVGMLTRCSADRWGEILDGHRYATAAERELESLALRDLTAIHRTLRRMSALALAEDETHKDLERELTADKSSPEAPLPHASDEPEPFDESRAPGPIHSSNGSDSSDPTRTHPPHSSHSSYPSSQSVPSVQSVDAFSSADEQTDLPATPLINTQRPVRVIPPVPEIRPIASSRTTPSRNVPSLRGNNRPHYVGFPSLDGRPAEPGAAPRCSFEYPSLEEEIAAERGEKERLKGFYPPGHQSLDELTEKLYGPFDPDDPLAPNGHAPHPRPPETTTDAALPLRPGFTLARSSPPSLNDSAFGPRPDESDPDPPPNDSS